MKCVICTYMFCPSLTLVTMVTNLAFSRLPVDDHDTGKRDYTSMVIEKSSDTETSQVQIVRSERQTVIEEVIPRVEETEKETIEEKLFRKLTKKFKICLDDVIDQ